MFLYIYVFKGSNTSRPEELRVYSSSTEFRQKNGINLKLFTSVCVTKLINIIHIYDNKLNNLLTTRIV